MRLWQRYRTHFSSSMPTCLWDTGMKVSYPTSRVHHSSMADSKPATEPHLPPEILDHIVDYLHSDAASLLSCGLSSRNLLRVSRYHLFRNMIMKLSATHLFSLLALLRSPANRIAPFVQTIVLFNVPAFLRTHGRSDVVRAIRIIPHILALLPHASSLSLRHSDLTRFPEDLFLQLCHHFRSFQGTLHLDAVHFHRFVDLANLVTAFKLLRHVSVNRVLWAHPSPPSDRLLLKQPLQTASACWQIHDAGIRYQDLFDWLKSQRPPAPVDSMYYHAETTKVRSDLNDFLSYCASALRHLTVSFPVCLNQHHFVDTSNCVNLRSLRMKQVMLAPATMVSRLLQSRISRIIADIPSPHLLESLTLELHVAATVSVEKSLQEFDWNGLTRFRSLRRITLVVDPGLSAEFEDAVASVFRAKLGPLADVLTISLFNKVAEGYE
ncbi:hypothetical protein BDN71DRAFT_933903 [Pleurotus eryngii]|uniref:F-box domain-containing protein n=1 Tax=Pleurotus eryngii TaxID=5323 RepID=A0A9P6DFL2_PLEER|nr:hypothetical protein BDN71DRAFT_933903 [Pleurotus eryngii]